LFAERQAKTKLKRGVRAPKYWRLDTRRASGPLIAQGIAAEYSAK